MAEQIRLDVRDASRCAFRLIMRAFSFVFVFLLASVWPAGAQFGEYEIMQVDAQAGSFTATLNGVTKNFRVRPSVEVSINGVKATFAEIEAGMKVKITTAEPLVASRLAATGIRARSQAEAPHPGGPGQASRKVRATIEAKSPDGFPIGDIRKGTRISIQYVEGKWKAGGQIPQFNPDGNNDLEFGEKDKLAIALPAAGGKSGQVLVVVPGGTKKRPFVYQAEEDFPGLVLRINGGPSSNPGKVIYDVVVLPPAR